MVGTKPPTTRPKFHLFVRYTFRKQAEAISPRDVSAVEYLLRHGRRQLETYEDPQVRDVRVSKDMRAWELDRHDMYKKSQC